MLTLVIGGAASGKSAYAESLCLRAPLPRTYLATMQVWDAECAARVANSLILFGICFLLGRMIANRLSGVVLLWGNSTSNSIGKIAISSDLTHASIIIR